MKQSVVVLVCLFLGACASGGNLETAGSFPPATGSGGVYKVGKPYEIDGITYYPREDWSYEEEGMASWYGDEFHGRPTANGETFDKNAMTAAHRTLPMPSIVRVTNLENGRTAVVRVNDRGPFARNRIIDVSHRVANELGFVRQGTTRVQVKIMLPETRAAIAQIGNLPATLLASAVNPVDRRVAVESISSLPATTPVIMPGQNIYIQTGAFGVRENADKVVQTLQGQYSTVVSRITIDNKPLYRVRLGPFTSVQEADRSLAAVRQAGHSGAHIVIE